MINANLMKLKIYWLISLFIIALWPEFGVRAQSNPIKVIEIADINIPDMPGYFVSAKVVDNDSYVVSLYSVENPTLKEEFKVSPFTENNFRDMFGLSLIRLGSKIKDLDIEKYNVFQSLVEKYAADNYI
ncbi:MAG: hypothetical protein KAX50_09870, partial [Saprospiraceae bacterium]|nr:hypothetical protein [Saprospiraceae bacterium]